MFGYINANMKELSTEDKAVYQSFYCGLCRKLKDVCGRKGQMLLNYDMTFLIILLSGLYEPETDEEEFTCSLHPLKKKSASTNEITEYAADMNILLSYHKFKDDWQDDRALTKKVLARMFDKQYQEISRKYPRQAKALEDYMIKLSVAESGNETNIDAVSGLMGTMLAEFFDWRQDEWSTELKNMGFYMGKFIYLMDAYEDVEEDEKKGLYNPFLNYEKRAEHPSDFDIYVKLILTSMMTECAKSFERLPILTYAELLRNILYSGVWTKFEICQAKRRKKTRKQKEEQHEKSL